MDWASSKYNGGEGKKVVNLSVGLPEQKYKIPPSCCRIPEEDAICVAARQAVIGADVSDVIFSDVIMNSLKVLNCAWNFVSS